MLCEEVGDPGWAKKAQILIASSGLEGQISCNVCVRRGSEHGLG